MKRDLLTLVLSLSLATAVVAQHPTVNKANEAYSAAKFAEAAQLYLLAAQFEMAMAPTYLFKAGCCYARAANNDLAFHALFAAVDRDWTDLDLLRTELDLGTLRSDPQWAQLEKAIPRNSLMKHLANIAAHAYQYRMRPAHLNGGSGTYTGYSIPTRVRTVGDATCSAEVKDADTILLKAVSTKWKGGIEATLTKDGRMSDVTYFGELQ